MASELSRFIEDELRNKGYAYDEDEAEANDNPHTSLIGALRVEVRQAVGRWHVESQESGLEFQASATLF